MVRPTTAPVIRFIPKVDMRGDDECWPWLGTRSGGRYGNFNMPSGKISAHRFAYALWVGPIGDGMIIMHTCDNPPCVNPKHLVQGTMAENIADRDAKGHHRPGGRGERTW